MVMSIEAPTDRRARRWWNQAGKPLEVHVEVGLYRRTAQDIVDVFCNDDGIPSEPIGYFRPSRCDAGFEERIFHHETVLNGHI